MITNQRQFDIILNGKIAACVLDISKKMYDCLRRHIINDVYYFDGKNRWYNEGSREPTWEFLDAFDFGGVQYEIKAVTNTLFYDWMSMSPPSQSNPYVHGNYYESKDRRESLAKILNVKGNSPSGTFDLRDKKRNAFWDEAIDEIDKNFAVWAKDAFNKYLK